MAGSNGVTIVKTGKTGDLNEREMKELLIGATITDIETTESGLCLETITLKLKDGRDALLREWNEPSWSHSSVGWIEVEVNVGEKDKPRWINPVEED